MKVQDILTDESKWTRGSYARGVSGRTVDYLGKSAVCFCLMGAIMRAASTETEQKEMYMAVNLKLNHRGIEGWNDAPERTFAEVRGLIEELDI